MLIKSNSLSLSLFDKQNVSRAWKCIMDILNAFYTKCIHPPATRYLLAKFPSRGYLCGMIAYICVYIYLGRKRRRACYRHIDFTPEDTDKRGIDFTQTTTIHSACTSWMKYRLNMNGSQVGAASRRQGS